MKTILNVFVSLLIISFAIPSQLEAQNIMILQYRRVPQDQMAEFIHRETTYWSKVAEKAIEDGNLLSWALLQKVGGWNMESASNVLFINVVKDLDRVGEMWDASKVFPDVPIEEIETNSMSTVTTTAFLAPGTYIEGPNTQPEDMGYVKINYINASSSTNLLNLENEHWLPFIEAEMAKEGTSQVAWGNARILYPLGPDIKANFMSFDVYPSLHEALMPKWSEDAAFPEEGMQKINEITLNRRGAGIYAVVKSIDADDDE